MGMNSKFLTMMGSESLTQVTLLNIIYFYFIWMGVLSACVSVHHVCAVPSGAEKGISSSGTGVVDGCELPCRCQEPNSGPPEDQQVLVNIELSLLLPGEYFIVSLDLSL